jgi:3-hydroxybutyryl-CoA dehydrogenase
MSMADTPPADRLSDHLNVTIVGGGLMGHGIAQVFAVAGAAVTVHDPEPSSLLAVPDRIAANLRGLGQDPGAARAVRLEADLERAVADAQWVFEAAPEKLDLKQALFARITAIVDDRTIVATNSSVMRPTEIAARAEQPERTVGTHWWNPPYLVPLVEVVRGEHTSEQTMERTLDLLRGLNKVAVRVERDVPGFVGNRLQHALWREAFALVDAGVCDAETIDTVVKSSFGIRMPVLGPMENADLVGLDLTLAIHDYVLPQLDPPSMPSSGLRRRVEAGEVGMRTGSGWREWDETTAQQIRDQLLDHLRKETQ